MPVESTTRLESTPGIGGTTGRAPVLMMMVSAVSSWAPCFAVYAHGLGAHEFAGAVVDVYALVGHHVVVGVVELFN